MCGLLSSSSLHWLGSQGEHFLATEDMEELQDRWLEGGATTVLEEGVGWNLGLSCVEMSQQEEVW